MENSVYRVYPVYCFYPICTGKRYLIGYEALVSWVTILITQCFNGTAQPERIGRVVFGYRKLSSLRRSENEI